MLFKGGRRHCRKIFTAAQNVISAVQHLAPNS